MCPFSSPVDFHCSMKSFCDRLPITVVTLGLFILVINGFLFWFVGSVLKGFTVADFWWGVGGAILYSVFSWALSSLLPKKSSQG